MSVHVCVLVRLSYMIPVPFLLTRLQQNNSDANSVQRVAIIANARGEMRASKRGTIAADRTPLMSKR